MSPPLPALMFDAYGTLLDIHSAVRRHAARLGVVADSVSALWRQRQLEYSWILSATGDYEDFATLTERALDFALAQHGIRDEGLRAALLGAYRALDPFPDALPALSRLRARGARLAVLSNGEPAMLAAALGSAGLAGALDHVLSVHALRRFKPDAEVYRLAVTTLGLGVRDIGFVSSNAWDAHGAARFGFRTFWLNRAGGPPEYGLERRAAVIRALEAVP